jgi:hypothetical protein
MNAIKIRLIFKRSLAVAPFAMLGLLLAVNAAVAQESQKPDSLTVLVAPIYYDINSKQVEPGSSPFHVDFHIFLFRSRPCPLGVASGQP